MTTAHRPTFDPARGKEALRGAAYHQRLLPAHTQLKYRRAGQGGAADDEEDGVRDLRAELLAAEAAHFAKNNGTAPPSASGTGRSTIAGHLTGKDDDDSDGDEGDQGSTAGAGLKRRLSSPGGGGGGGGGKEVKEEAEESWAAKRRRILEETRDIDADSTDDSEADDASDDDSDDDSDAELQRELDRVRREKALKREQEEKEREKEEEDKRMRDIALGNPLLNKQDYTMKRRWDDDVVFRNQARGTEDQGKKKEFVNDLLRSDFHKRFMGKYVR